MSNTQTQAETRLHDQTQLLPKKQLILVLCLLSLAQLVSFLDQSAIGVLQPEIARDLDAGSSISWCGTATMIGNTAAQVLWGRLSDLYGRKNVMLGVLVLLALSDLGCALAKNAVLLYLCRATAGIANGGISSDISMIITDIVTLKERGKYQGIVGVMVGLGSAIGPILASTLAAKGNWHGIYYLQVPLVVVTALICWKWLPSNMPKVNWRDTIAKIDWMGLITGTATVILLLVATAEGEHAEKSWNSPLVISCFATGLFCLIWFLLTEWKWAKLPMMPLSMFRDSTVATMLGQTFLLGACFQIYQYFLPLYFRNALHMSPLAAATLQLPLVVAQTIAAPAAGYLQSRLERYAEIKWFGFGIWTAGAISLTQYDENTNPGLFCLSQILIGIGIGAILQPSLVALQAQCSKSDRAIVTSNRNFLRSSGGAAGLAVSSAIAARWLKVSLPPRLKSVASSTFAAPDMSKYSAEDHAAIEHSYAAASRAVFILCVGLMSLCLFLCFFVRDKGLTRDEERKELITPTQDEEKETDRDLEEGRRHPTAEDARHSCTLEQHVIERLNGCQHATVQGECGDRKTLKLRLIMLWNWIC